VAAPTPNPCGQFGERLAFTQAGEDQQGLLPGTQLPPARPDRGPVAADDPGHEGEVWLFQCAWPVWQACLMIPAEPAGADGRRSPRHVRIVHLPAPAFRPLADGDLAAANAVSPVPLPEYFISPEWRSTWRMRSGQVEQDPASAAWVTSVIWDELPTRLALLASTLAESVWFMRCGPAG
jgi:hypothetical protein